MTRHMVKWLVLVPDRPCEHTGTKTKKTQAYLLLCKQAKLPTTMYIVRSTQALWRVCELVCMCQTCGKGGSPRRRSGSSTSSPWNASHVAPGQGYLLMRVRSSQGRLEFGILFSVFWDLYCHVLSFVPCNDGIYVFVQTHLLKA